MSESEKPPAYPDGTIELDRIDTSGPALPAETEAPARSTRKTPPPLPGFAQQISFPPQAALPSMPPPPAPRSIAKTIGYIAMVLVLIAVAIVAGRRVGARARTQAAAPESIASTAVSAGVPTPSASSDSVLMVPTIEMK